MATLVFCVVFFMGFLVVDGLIIQPFHLLNVFHIPRLVMWGSLFIMFAWLFGDQGSS